MISFVFFLFVIAITLLQFFYKKGQTFKKFCTYLLDNLFLICIGLFSILASYGHIFMGPEIAKEIGWPPNNPFQFEVGISNFAFGILGLLSYKIKDSFRLSTLIGWSTLLFGAFIGHLIQAYTKQDFAPYNFGIFIWFNDLFLPILTITLFIYTDKKENLS